MVTTLKDAFKKANKKVFLSKISMITFFIASFSNIAFAASSRGNSVFPWWNFLDRLIEELTGPLPFGIGIMAIVGTAFSLLTGRMADTVTRFIGLIIAVSIALTAPTLMSLIGGDAGGLLFK